MTTDAAIVGFASSQTRRRRVAPAYKPERPHTTKDKENENVAMMAAHAKFTMNGSPSATWPTASTTAACAGAALATAATTLAAVDATTTYTHEKTHAHAHESSVTRSRSRSRSRVRARAPPPPSPRVVES